MKPKKRTQGINTETEAQKILAYQVQFYNTEIKQTVVTILRQFIEDVVNHDKFKFAHHEMEDQIDDEIETMWNSKDVERYINETYNDEAAYVIEDKVWKIVRRQIIACCVAEFGRRAKGIRDQLTVNSANNHGDGEV